MIKLLSPVFKPFGVVVGFLAIAYLATCVYLYLRQTRMMFFPSAVIETTPADLNLPYEEVWIPVDSKLPGNSNQFHGWWIPGPDPNKVLLYLHGNGVNVGANVNDAARYYQMGFSVLLIDYRGYGKSVGSFPSEATVYEDAYAAWTYLTHQRNVPPKHIFIYGHSLGGAIAIDLIRRIPTAAGLIVQSSFTSMRDMVTYAKNLEIFPIDRLLTQKFDSHYKLQALGATRKNPHNIPTLFIHGTADFQVPASMSEALYGVTPEPKELWLVPDAGHNDVGAIAGPDYFQVVSRFVEQAIALRSQPHPSTP